MAFTPFNGRRNSNNQQQQQQQQQEEKEKDDDFNGVDLLSIDGKTPSIIDFVMAGERKIGVAVTQWAKVDDKGQIETVFSPQVQVFQGIYGNKKWGKWNGKAKETDMAELLAALAKIAKDGEKIKAPLLAKWEAKWGRRQAAIVPETNPALTMERLRRLAGVEMEPAKPEETTTPTEVEIPDLPQAQKPIRRNQR